jgi:hypothetical protein
MARNAAPTFDLSQIMPTSHFIAARSTRPLLAIASLALLGVAGCNGGGDETTGPVGTTDPGAAGRYRAVRNITAITCTPSRPPAGGGTVNLEAYSDTVVIRLVQSGTRLTVSYPELQTAATDTGSVDPSGTIRLGSKKTFQEAVRTGNRTFFVEATATEDFRKTASPTVYAGGGIYVSTFREGTATAPKFADCYRSGSTQLTRIGDS